MTPEEIQMVAHWMVYFEDADEMIGANWHQHLTNRGRTPPKEPLAETGRKLREQVMEQQGGMK